MNKKQPYLDSTTVDVQNAKEVRYWSKRLNTTTNKLILAIHTVGTKISDIKKWLNEDL